MQELDKEESIILFKNLLIDMAMRLAALEKVLLDKNLISLDEISAADEDFKKEARDVISKK